MTDDRSPIEVIHRDADLLVLNKPAGLPTTSPDGRNCLVALAQGLDPDAPRLHASSRLDASVSGLVTFARTRRATQALLDARKQGLYVRRYLALGEVLPSPPEGQWHWAIGLDPREPRRRVALAVDDPGGQAACTRYRLRREGERLVVMDLWPQTGRTHQLRVHAAKAGVPIIGDRHYGGSVRLVAGDGRVSRADRVMLHCARVELPSPAGGATLVFRSPVPRDLTALHRALAPDAGRQLDPS